jgi:hypothetical protein
VTLVPKCHIPRHIITEVAAISFIILRLLKKIMEATPLNKIGVASHLV